MIDTRKGEVGRLAIMSKLVLAGHQVALPVGADWRFDLIVLRDGKLLRVQCKYVTSDGKSITVPCRSTDGNKSKNYTAEEIDWIMVFDATTGNCYYLPSSLLGRSSVSLRITPPRNGQTESTLWAKDFETW